MSGITVMGLGNLIRGDDGVGVYALRALAQAPGLPLGINFVDGGTLGLELSCYAADADCLLVLDAVDTGQAPGTVSRLEARNLQGLPGGSSVHSLGLADLLITLALTVDHPQKIVLLGVQPGKIDWSVSLSPAVEAALPCLVEAALRELRRWRTEVTQCV